MAGPRERGTKIPKPMARVFTGLHGFVYRISKGKVGGRFGGGEAGGQVVILGTTGAKTGKARTSPLLAFPHGDDWVVIASFSGHDFHPGWYHNLVASPEATLTIGAETSAVRARFTQGAERDELWERVSTAYTDYQKYERVTDREIPVVVLEAV